MPYTVASSEKTRKSGSEGETKALLYLMNLRSDSNEIYYFVVDFFNDLTGMDQFAEKLWDIQSKAKKNNSPNEIGKELVTLYKNYISDFDFSYYILFFGGMSDIHLEDSSLDTFRIDNIKESARSIIINSLINEAKKKEYIDNSKITNDKIEAFLKEVLFVIDNRESYEYVREIIKNHPSIIPNNQVLLAIFNEIRNKQSEKKNTKVEGVTIQTNEQALDYCRHLTNNEIKLLTLQRIINRNPVEKSVPIAFLSIYNSWTPENQKEMFDECKQSLCRALFNKNTSEEFWTLFEKIYVLIQDNPKWDVNKIYQSIDSELKRAVPDLDLISLKFFIAIVKDGIQDDN